MTRVGARCLSPLVARVRPWSLVGHAVEEDVGVRLEPERLVPPRRLGEVRHRLPLRPAALCPQRVERAVGGNPVQPGTDRRPLLELLETAPGGEERLLEQVLGILQRPDDPVQVDLELAAVRVGELPEGVLVAIDLSFHAHTDTDAAPA